MVPEPEPEPLEVTTPAAAEVAASPTGTIGMENHKSGSDERAAESTSLSLDDTAATAEVQVNGAHSVEGAVSLDDTAEAAEAAEVRVQSPGPEEQSPGPEQSPEIVPPHVATSLEASVEVPEPAAAVESAQAVASAESEDGQSDDMARNN